MTNFVRLLSSKFTYHHHHHHQYYHPHHRPHHLHHHDLHQPSPQHHHHHKLLLNIIIITITPTAGQLCWRSLRSAGGRPTTQIVHTAGGRRQHFVNFIFAFLPFFLFVLRFLHSTFCSSVFDFDEIKHISSFSAGGRRKNFVTNHNDE